MPYDVESAHKAGLTDKDIAEYLAKKHGYQLDKARESGLTDTEITNYLAMSEDIPSAPKVPEKSLEISSPGAALAEVPFAMGTGLMTQALGGLYGLSQMPTKGFKGGAEAMEEVQQLGGIPIPFTERYLPTRYEPRTEEAKSAMKAISWPFEKFSEMTNKAGTETIRQHPDWYGIASSTADDILGDLLMFAMEKPAFKAQMAPRVAAKVPLKTPTELPPELKHLAEEASKKFTQLNLKGIKPKPTGQLELPGIGRAPKVEPMAEPWTPSKEQMGLFPSGQTELPLTFESAKGVKSLTTSGVEIPKAPKAVQPTPPLVVESTAILDRKKLLSDSDVSITKDIPQLVGSTVDAGTIRLQFDNAYRVPAPEEIKFFAKSKGYDVEVQKFRQDIISGAQGATNYRLDVFRSDGSITYKGAQELSKEFGGTFRTKTTAEQALPLDERMGRAHTRMGENLGIVKPPVSKPTPGSISLSSAPLVVESTAKISDVISGTREYVVFPVDQFSGKVFSQVEGKGLFIENLADGPKDLVIVAKSSKNPSVQQLVKKYSIPEKEVTVRPAPEEIVPIPLKEVVKPEIVTATLDRQKLLSDSAVAREYSKVAESANPLEPDWTVADKWLETEGHKLYQSLRAGKKGGVADLVQEEKLSSVWDKLNNEAGGVDLKKFSEALTLARYYSGKYVPRLGTVGHEDLSRLQYLKRRLDSPSWMAKVEPFPHRLTDYLINRGGLTVKDIDTITRVGVGKDKLFKQSEQLAKSAGYVPEGGSFVGQLKKDYLHIKTKGGFGEQVLSSRKGAAVAISEALIDYEIETNQLREAKEHIVNQVYKHLSEEEAILNGKVLNKYWQSGNIPPEVRAQLPTKVLDAFEIIRTQVLDDMWKLSGVESEVPRKGQPKVEYIEGYFPLKFEDLQKFPADQRAKVIRSFAHENKIDYLTAETILKGKIPEKGFFGPLSKVRKYKITPELEATRAWGPDVLRWYVRGTSRYIGLKKFNPIAKENLLKLFPDERALTKSNIYTAMREHVDAARGIPITIDMEIGPTGRRLAAAEGLRQYVTKMGGNASFGIINLTQYPLNSGIHVFAKGKPGDGIWNFVHGATSALTHKGRQLAKASGITTDVGKGDLTFSDVHGVARKMAEITGVFANVTERFNKIAEFNRVYPDLLKQGKANGLSGPELINWVNSKARYSVATHQFLAGKGDRPIYFQGPVGTTAGKFKLFTIKQLEFISNLRGREIPTFIMMNQLVGGPDAIGLDYLEAELKDSSFKDSEGAQAFFKSIDYLRKGSLSGATGFDMTGKIGLGFFPGMERSDKFWEELARLAVPVTGSDALNLITDIQEGRVAMSLEQIQEAYSDGQLGKLEFDSLVNAFAKSKGDFLAAPIGLKRGAKTYVESLTGIKETRFGERIEESKDWNTLWGFQSPKLREAQIEIKLLQNDQAEASFKRKLISAEFADAVRRMDDRKMDQVIDQVEIFNNKYPELGIGPIKMAQLRNSFQTKDQEMWWRKGQNKWGRARLMESGVFDQP